MLRSLAFLGLATTLLATAAARAQSIPITNFSFEDHLTPNGEFHVLNPTGWNVFNPNSLPLLGNNAVGVLNPTGTTFFTNPNAVPHGNNAALIYLEQRAGTTLPGSPIGLFQTLSATLQINTLYTLTVGVGNIASGTGLGASAGFGFADLSGFPGYSVELLAGGQVIALDDNSLSIAEGKFATATVNANIGAAHALAGQALGIRLVNLNATGNVNERGREVDFDNVTLTATAVPEPHAYLMFSVGLILLFMGASRTRASFFVRRS